jgi:hypothetical protein
MSIRSGSSSRKQARVPMGGGCCAGGMARALLDMAAFAGALAARDLL